MKVLITGCKGMLGTDLVKQFNVRNDVTGVDLKDFDITNLPESVNIVRNIKPDVIIHPAAYTDVDGCESNPELAFKVNALGARNIAIAAQEINAAILYLSTDYVYDGNKAEPYYEYDKTNPLSIYGKSKLEGENLVKSLCNKYYIVRTSWLFGKNGKNFVRTMLDLSKTRDSLKVVNDQVGSPTFTIDLASGLEKLVDSGCYGTFHLTNSDYCSWYDFTKKIYEIAGIKHMAVEATTTEKFNRPAPRPKNSRLIKFNWKLNGFNELRTYEEAVKDYLKQECL